MLSAPVALWAHAGDDIWPDHTDQTHKVAQDLLTAPFFECLLSAEGISEIYCPREVLLGPINSVGRRKFLGSQCRQGIEQLWSNLVLSPVATRGGHQRGADTLTLTQQSEQPIIFVIGVRGCHHERARVADLS